MQAVGPLLAFGDAPREAAFLRRFQTAHIEHDRKLIRNAIPLALVMTLRPLLHDHTPLVYLAVGALDAAVFSVLVALITRRPVAYVRARPLICACAYVVHFHVCALLGLPRPVCLVMLSTARQQCRCSERAVAAAEPAHGTRHRVPRLPLAPDVCHPRAQPQVCETPKLGAAWVLWARGAPCVAATLCCCLPTAPRLPDPVFCVMDAARYHG